MGSCLTRHTAQDGLEKGWLLIIYAKRNYRKKKTARPETALPLK
jgi:hypothetical protein